MSIKPLIQNNMLKKESISPFSLSLNQIKNIIEIIKPYLLFEETQISNNPISNSKTNELLNPIFKTQIQFLDKKIPIYKICFLYFALYMLKNLPIMKLMNIYLFLYH
jgi:hypothetical protein